MAVRRLDYSKNIVCQNESDKSQLDHFLNFITSAHLIQDLPFGERLLKLSTGEVLTVPNVIRTMIPKRIVMQYFTFCEESSFEPLQVSENNSDYVDEHIEKETEVEKEKLCIECGSENDVGYRYCRVCGGALQKANPLPTRCER